MKAAHNVLYIHEEAHTNVRFISCDGHQLHERGVDLEVEGERYIEMHRGPAAYVLGPPPSRGRGLELEGGVACHVEYSLVPIRNQESASPLVSCPDPTHSCGKGAWYIAFDAILGPNAF